MFQEWLKDYEKLKEENKSMSEEEILEIMKNLLLMPTDWIIKSSYKGNLEHIGALQANEAIEGLLDLYQREKEKNKEHEDMEYRLTKVLREECIFKSKIKEKIDELEKEIEEKQENCCDFTLMYEHEIDTNKIIETLKELLKGE